MTKALVLAALGGTAVLLCACADDYYRPRHLQGGRYGAYYDNAYGPIYGGRWGEDGAYYYRGRADGPYLRDEGRHFRRDAYAGYRGVEFGAGPDVGVRGPYVGLGVQP